MRNEVGREGIFVIYDNIKPLSETGKANLLWLIDFICRPVSDQDLREWIDYFVRNSDLASEDGDD